MQGDITSIKTLDVKEMYPLFALEISEFPEHKEIYKQVRFGIFLKFDVYEYILGSIVVKGKKGLAIVNGRSFRLSDVWSELEMRNNLMKKWIEENVSSEALVNLRGLNEKK